MMLSDIEQLIISVLVSKHSLAERECKAMVLAQMSWESGGFKHLVENLNYTAPSLMAVFPKHFKDLPTAREYAHNPEKTANLVYAYKNGNGSESSGDGWRYRGRGYVQITGKFNYARFGFAGHPEMLATDQFMAIDVSVRFLISLRGFLIASSRGDVETCTRLINGGLNGVHQREDLYNHYLAKV